MCKWEIQQYSLLRASHCLLKVVGKQVSTTTERWGKTRQPIPVVVRVISTWDSSCAFSQLSTTLAKEFYLANEMFCIKCKLPYSHQPLKAPRRYTHGPKKPCPLLSWRINMILSWFEHAGMDSCSTALHSDLSQVGLEVSLPVCRLDERQLQLGSLQKGWHQVARRHTAGCKS